METAAPALSAEQEDAVRSPPGPLLVLAGAGSGKTRLLVHRVAYLVHKGTPPGRILLMTFTNRAAAEMSRRVAALLDMPPPRSARPPALALAESRQPTQPPAIWAGTFHHIALRVLRQHGRRLGLPDFAVLDGKDALDLLQTCLAARHPGAPPWPTPRLLATLLSYSVNAERPLDEVLRVRAPAHWERAAELRRVCDLYARRKLAMNLLDFDDLLLLLRLLLLDCPDVAAGLRARFDHLLVDEYQDTSLLQAAIADDLAADHRSLLAVGDEAQSIYAFRGASPDNLRHFQTRWPDARVLHLSTNYRSTPDIVALASRSIAFCRPPPRSAPKPDPVALRPMRAHRPAAALRPVVVPVPDAATQSRFVARRIRDLLDAGRRASDIAVLYRNHLHAAGLAAALQARRIPSVLHSGPRRLVHDHIKDVLSHLRYLHNPADELAADNLRRQHGALPRSLLSELAAAADPPAALLEIVLARHYRAHAARQFPDAAARLADLDDLLQQAAAHGGPLREFLADLSLLTTAEPGDAAPAEDAVVLSTIHRAKGLEWGVVFLIWLAEGHLPSPFSGTSVAAEHEERRLFYVAATRARDQLYLCHPQTSAAGAPLLPSRFLRELDGPAAPFDRWTVA